MSADPGHADPHSPPLEDDLLPDARRIADTVRART